MFVCWCTSSWRRHEHAYDYGVGRDNKISIYIDDDAAAATAAASAAAATLSTYVTLSKVI